MKLFDRIEYVGRQADRRYTQSRYQKRWYYLSYTALFLVFMGIIAAGYLVIGKSFIWGPNGDGMRQHYTSLAYFGEYLREILTNIFINHTFEIPMWDVHMGYGSDIITTLHYYTIGDPLNLLSVFVPQKYTEYLYEFLLVLRIYLSGIAFSAYCRYHGNKNIPALLGTVMYTFSGWMMVAGFKHPFFINPCIYFPLILLGIDKIFKKQKPYLFVIMVGISAVSNFYFFYMIAIFMVIYAVYRYFMLFKKIRIKEVFSWLGKFAGYGIIGVLMSCVVFLPTVMALLGTDRMAAENYIPGIYSVKHYHMLLAALTGKYLSKYTIIGVSVMALLGLLVLFAQRKKNTALKIGFVMCIIFLCVPYTAHLFNGMSYVTNRWNWALVMLLSYIFVKVYPDIFTLSKRQKTGIIICTGLYCLYIALDKYARDMWNIVICVIFLAAVIVLMGAYDYLQKNKTWQFLLLLCGMGLSITVNIYYSFTSSGNDQSGVWSFVDAGQAYNIVHEPVQGAVAEFSDSDQYRYEQEGSGVQFNSAILTGLNGGQFFYSLANGYVSQFFDETYSNKPLEQRFQNLDERSFLMKLLSMKYFVGPSEVVPYGFEKIEEVEMQSDLRVRNEAEKDLSTAVDRDAAGLEDTETLRSTVGIYEDKNAMPMAYTYDSYIDTKDYQDMNVIQRQQAMMQGVVLDDSSLKKCEPEDTSVKVDYKITDLQDVELFDNRIKAKADGASCVLKIEGLPECETNVVFKNLNYLEVNRRHKYSDEEWNALSLSEKYDIFVKDQKIDNEATIYLNTEVDGAAVGKKILLLTNKNNFYGGRHDFVSNLSYHEDGITYIKLTFSEKGSYKYEDLSVYCQPVDKINEYADKLTTDKVENLTIDGNNVSCQVELEEQKALVFSLPYSKGWSAVVDGREAELKQANTMFMAVELEPGEHEIELHYTTPYIKWGLLLSGAGVVIFIAVIVVQKKKKRKTA
ncbi:MAG: YfhO family protein [Eubacteriales bacterium]|nr:YfhO family protein [Eubacteriales bacterium]